MNVSFWVTWACYAVGAATLTVLVVRAERRRRKAATLAHARLRRAVEATQLLAEATELLELAQHDRYPSPAEAAFARRAHAWAIANVDQDTAWLRDNA